MTYNKLPPNINNIVSDNVKLLAQLFPSAVKDGQVDFTALKEELGQFEEIGKEKYELTWSGKQNAKKLSQEDVYNRTLKFVEKDSKKPDTTENLYIEGDNLEVLKLLRQNYYGAIKMIYIDPPYNTGNDFVYNDNFDMDREESDIAEGIVSEDNERLQKNQQSSNRYHANWLNMMYPRLKVAKDLLTDDGVIFISIDDNEVDNLKKICNDVFGEDNFVANIIWKHTQQSKNDELHFSRQYNYTITVTKNKNYLHSFYFERTEEDNKNYGNPDNDPKGLWRSGDVRSPNYRKTLCFDIIAPDNTIIKSPVNGWRWSEDTIKEKIATGEIKFKDDNSGIVRKIYLCEQSGRTPENLWDNVKFGTTRQAAATIKELFDGKQIFDTPKPYQLVKSMLEIATNKYSLVLDFFSGSATTAHAVMQLNSEDGGNRKFIMVQVPEETEKNSEAYKAGYKNICEIGKERIRRAGEKIKQEIETANTQLKLGEEPKQVPDIGFKVFKTADTNIKWNLYDEWGQIDTDTMSHTPDLADFTRGFTDVDVVYEVMLRQKDVPLSAPLEALTDIGKRTYLYGYSYLVCLETEITKEMVESLASLNPLPIKFVFRDTAFKDDINLKDETFRRLKAEIDKNAGETKPAYTVEFI